MAALQQVVLPHKGLYTGMSTVYNNKAVMAYVWADRVQKYFVSTCASMRQGNPTTRYCWRGFENGKDKDRTAKVVRLEIPMPEATEWYFDLSSKIDEHNRTRETCGMDKRFKTQDWLVRVNFSLMSMTFTNAYLLYKASKGTAKGIMTLSLFF